MTTKPKKRRIKRVQVQTMCRFPFEEHPFTYVKTTKPKVFCDDHRDGWVDDDGVQHGDTRRVRKNEDGSYRLVVEETLPEEQRRQNYGLLRQDAARWLQEHGLPMLGDLRPADGGQASVNGPFHWEVVQHIVEDGVTATTYAIVTDEDGQPRFDPTLYRAVVVVEAQHTVEQPVLEPKTKDDEDVTQAHKDLYGDKRLAKRAPDLNGKRDPLRKPDWETDLSAKVYKGEVGQAASNDPVKALIPDASPLQVAIGRIRLRIGRATDWRLFKEARLRDPKQVAAYERAFTEALMVAAARQETTVTNSGSTGSSKQSKETQ